MPHPSPRFIFHGRIPPLRLAHGEAGVVVSPFIVVEVVTPNEQPRAAEGQRRHADLAPVGQLALVEDHAGSSHSPQLSHLPLVMLGWEHHPQPCSYAGLVCERMPTPSK